MPQPETPVAVEAPSLVQPDPLAEARRIIVEARAVADILRKAGKYQLSLILIDACYAAEHEMARP